MGETDHHVHCVVRLHLEEVAIVDDHADHVLDVVGLFRIVRDDGGKAGRGPFRIVRGFGARRLLVAALRDVFEELADLGEALFLGLGQEMRDARLDVVHLGAAQRVECHVLTRRDADDLGPRDEHVADAVDHEREVGDRGRVHRAARARAEDEAQLRDQPARLYVAPEDLRVAGKRNDAFLDARAARVVDADDRDPVAQREVHHLDHLLREDLAERAAEDAGVVAEQHHVATVDSRHAGDHAVAWHPRGVPGEQIDLFERVAVDQARDPLSRGQLAFRVLPGKRLGVAVARLVLALAQLVERVDLARGALAHLWRCASRLGLFDCMNIQRCPSRSSAR